MNILVVGSGGREHAIAWKLANSDLVDQVYIAPGNPGTARCGENVDLDIDDFQSILNFVRTRAIDLTVVGPEKPLVNGIVDEFRASGHSIVGPTALAARLEGSKTFAKNFMVRHGIPTAMYRSFTREEYDKAAAYLVDHVVPVVIKASGLAAGKGAVVCMTREHAENTLRDMLVGNAFGSASDSVVIEEFMEGEEASIFAICDGTDYVCLSTAQDHKRIGEGDSGPNTGGMGAYAPAPAVSDNIMTIVQREIIEPVLTGMRKDGHPYTGFLFVGIMLTPIGPRVVEFNCRLGDPETQVILAMLATDFASLLDACANGGLRNHPVDFHSGSAACVVMASEGYPGTYPKGVPISGISEAESLEGTLVFQAGTKLSEGRLETSGGRVLNLVGFGDDLAHALNRAYAGIERIRFEGSQYRRDIGARGLARLNDVGA